MEEEAKEIPKTPETGTNKVNDWGNTIPKTRESQEEAPMGPFGREQPSTPLSEQSKKLNKIRTL